MDRFRRIFWPYGQIQDSISRARCLVVPERCVESCVIQSCAMANILSFLFWAILIWPLIRLVHWIVGHASAVFLNSDSFYARIQSYTIVEAHR
jgi:hypothetical protein